MEFSSSFSFEEILKDVDFVRGQIQKNFAGTCKKIMKKKLRIYT